LLLSYHLGKPIAAIGKITIFAIVNLNDKNLLLSLQTIANIETNTSQSFASL